MTLTACLNQGQCLQQLDDNYRILWKNYRCTSRQRLSMFTTNKPTTSKMTNEMQWLKRRGIEIREQTWFVNPFRSCQINNEKFTSANSRCTNALHQLRTPIAILIQNNKLSISRFSPNCFLHLHLFQPFRLALPTYFRKGDCPLQHVANNHQFFHQFQNVGQNWPLPRKLISETLSPSPNSFGSVKDTILQYNDHLRDHPPVPTQDLH